MKRTYINPIVDLVAAFLFLGMMATGYILRFTLPPGTNKVFNLWGLTRHQWGSIHFWLSLGFLGIVFLHIFLHWQWIVSVIERRFHLRRRSPNSLLRRGLLALILFILSCTFFALATHRGVKPITEICASENCPSDKQEITAHPLEKPNNTSEIEFWKNVYPLLEQKCYSCHNSRQSLGNFQVDRRSDFFNNEIPLVVPGNSSKSPLIEILSGARQDMPMPDRHKLPQEDLLLLKSWIDSGAKWSVKPNFSQ